MIIWRGVSDHISRLISATATTLDTLFQLERAVTALLRLAVRSVSLYVYIYRLISATVTTAPQSPPCTCCSSWSKLSLLCSVWQSGQCLCMYICPPWSAPQPPPWIGYAFPVGVSCNCSASPGSQISVSVCGYLPPDQRHSHHPGHAVSAGASCHCSAWSRSHSVRSVSLFVDVFAWSAPQPPPWTCFFSWSELSPHSYAWQLAWDRPASLQCCGSRIKCLFDPWIRDPEQAFSWFQILDSGSQTHIFESLV